MTNEVTFKKRDLVIAVGVILATMVAYALVMPQNIHNASAAGGTGSSTPTATQCVAPAVTDAVKEATDTSTEPTKAIESTDQSTTKTVEKTSTTNNETHIVSDLVKVKTGDIGILNHNLNNNDVDVNVSDVVDGGILNPVTNVLTGVLHVL